MNRYVLLFECPDKKGIVAKVSDFIFSRDGNIIAADQHSTDPEGGHFFMRVEFVAEAPAETLRKELEGLASGFNARFRLHDASRSLRMGIMVSEPDHCLLDLLYLWRSGELKAEIPFVISNAENNRALAQQFKVPFYFVPADKDTRKEQEILGLIKDKTDFLALARYMLVLSEDFLNSYGKDVINIHHGLLPSFKGADPYGQALSKGVKVIGATAHFVTQDLDEGPIIAQAVREVSHKDDISSLKRKGKNLEKEALSRAVRSYLEHRIIRSKNTTIVF